MTQMALWLSQAQFFVSLSFMLLFLLLEIGLAWALAFFKLSVLAGREQWMQAYRFWVRIFALAFILAFSSSVPVMIQFGSLWPALMDRIGNVASPLLAVSVLSIFIFKSCLVGAMLFGQRHMPERLHVVLVVLVAVGLTVAAICPVMLFSWMRTPTGAVFSYGQYVVTSWKDVLFNPSFPWYAILLMCLAFTTTALFVLGVSALQSLRRPLVDVDKAVFRGAARASVMALCLLCGVALLAGRALAPHEPARAAAALGYWKSAPEPSVALLASTEGQDEDAWAWRWEGVGHPFLAKAVNGNFRGLDEFAGMAPPRALTFWSLRGAVLMAVLMLMATGIAGWVLRRPGADPAALPAWGRRGLCAVGVGGWLMAVMAFAHVIAGANPYAVAGTVTLSEVLAGVSVPTLVVGGSALLVVYGFCMTGFFQLLSHGAHYGVVPVARYRGRA
jgi:Cytochrome bd-type quinol oxidase, subunit 1